MRLEGNDEQWTNGNPCETVLREDIKAGQSYMVEDEGKPIATFAFVPCPDSTYACIYQGEWLDDAPYYVIHRMASLADVHGIMSTVLGFAFSHTPNIRIDTHRKNATMRRLLLKHGFRYCGIIYLADGAERLAYQLRK